MVNLIIVQRVSGPTMKKAGQTLRELSPCLSSRCLNRCNDSPLTLAKDPEERSTSLMNWA